LLASAYYNDEPQELVVVDISVITRGRAAGRDRDGQQPGRMEGCSPTVVGIYTMYIVILLYLALSEYCSSGLEVLEVLRDYD